MLGKFRKKAANLHQPNRLLLTDEEKLIHLKVQRTDWALLGFPWGALSFWAVGRAPVVIYYCSLGSAALLR